MACIEVSSGYENLSFYTTSTIGCHEWLSEQTCHKNLRLKFASGALPHLSEL